MIATLLLPALLTVGQPAPKEWTPGIPFPPRTVRYQPAKYTQRIAVTNNRDTIDPVQRSLVPDPHFWAQPGGLASVSRSAWTSATYKHIPVDGQAWIADIAVWNGSNYQNNRGRLRSYPVGTVFTDVLMNAGGVVFEHRELEKTASGWAPGILYKNAAARPAGYQFMTRKQCLDCHSNAGSGLYAAPLVSGGDFIFSDPLFPELER